MASRANLFDFAGVRVAVRRSIGAFRRRDSRRRGGVADPGRDREFSGRLGRPAGGRCQTDPFRSRSRQDHPVPCVHAGRSVSGDRGYSRGQLSPSGRGRLRRPRTGQGLPLWPGHARWFADRVRSDRPGQDREVLCPGCGQRPAAAAGAGVRRSRSHQFRSVARAGEPASAEARHCRRRRVRRSAGGNRRSTRDPRRRIPGP